MTSATFPHRVAMAAALCASLFFPTLSHGQGETLKRSFCVFDPVGANGPLFAITKTFQPVALKQGIKLNLRAYTDEKVAAEDFKAGQCDAVLLTGTRPGSSTSSPVAGSDGSCSRRAGDASSVQHPQPGQGAAVSD
ncbi:hypothetical protein AU14_15800 [Marinobacter similis]|uniref:Solute-binding protein family 3/N-terminal domain-containing protein n=1 Tax=Marinobacter similis TaxID=1420916 RepID=W5YMF1_9GAMM|nr:hypothetical protein AU14_15800 [Marinobacter similis]